MRARLDEFKIVTTKAGYRWRHLDVTTAFAEWMNSHEYRDAYFQQPGVIEPALIDFQKSVADRVRHALEAPESDEKTVIALLGVGALYPMARVSRLLEEVAWSIRGRLLVFFPGENDGPNYRLLKARDGWNYLAIPVTPGMDAS